MGQDTIVEQITNKIILRSRQDPPPRTHPHRDDFRPEPSDYDKHNLPRLFKSKHLKPSLITALDIEDQYKPESSHNYSIPEFLLPLNEHMNPFF